LPLRLLTDDAGAPALVELSLPESARLRARIWIAQVGRVPLLLLDSDIPENDHNVRGVTDRLYGGDQEHRMQQEILAGIGGVRAIRAYTAIHGLPAPEVFHMNEGHAGFLGTERIRELVDAGLDFDTALTVVRSSTVFTTHTPVPAGIDRFPVEMVQRYFANTAADPDSLRWAPRTIQTSSIWPTWVCGSRSAPTVSRCCTVR
jgi:starch phosphorylase